MKQRLEKSAILLPLALLLTACGALDLGPDDGSDQRRAYVNDAAANDSLPPTLIDAGVYFVMQPGKRYSLKVEGAAAGDYLQMYVASGGFYSLWKNVEGASQGGVPTFTMRDSTATAANYYLARLRSSVGGPAARPAKVRLVPADTVTPDTLKVRLMMIRTLAGLGTTTAKEIFAHEFMRKLAVIYRGQGIILDTSYQIVEPTAPAFTVDFGDATNWPGGTRLPNTIYLYLVNQITIDGKSDPNQVILGFAPREAFDLTSSEVVLSVQNGSAAEPIATTAAHEMGHFIGLRHTTSTELDQRGDDDRSNFEDGFVATPVCAGLGKRMLAKSLNLQQIRMPGGRHYCLRTAVDDCTQCPDRANLMFPYQLPAQCNQVQETLVPEQSNFIRQNLGMFRR